MHRTKNKNTLPRRLARLSAAALIALGGALGISVVAAAPALAHDKLVSYAPLEDAFRLTFNNEVLDVGAEIIVTDKDGADVADGAPKFDGRDVTQGLQPGLADGDYEADWRLVSSDGHPIQGVLKLTVAAGEITALEPVAEGEEAEHEHADGDEHADGEHSDGEHGDGEHSDEDHADAAHDHAAETAGGPGVGTVITVLVIAAVLVGGIVTTLSIRGRRAGSAAQTPSDTEEHSQPSQD